jgi:pimeloyl-ACP methyl ester carboxylesterase
MGGPIVELMSVHFPQLAATLITTTCDLRPSSLAYDGLYPPDITLSRLKETYVEWMQRFLRSPSLSQEELLEERILCWKILNGSVILFEEKLYRDIHAQFLMRLKAPESLPNHLLAIKRSFEMIQTAPFQVKVPTLIIHGSEDPILAPDHGEALRDAIANSRYLFVPGMGHVLNGHFYELIIPAMQEQTRTSLIPQTP